MKIEGVSALGAYKTLTFDTHVVVRQSRTVLTNALYSGFVDVC